LMGDGVPADIAEQVERLREDGASVMLLSIDGVVCGLLAARDTLRAGTADALADLKARGIRLVLATGDAPATAKRIAAGLPLDEVHAGMVPDQKLVLVERLQGEGYRVAMVGDGINDAPALARADVGIAIGGGTDVAIRNAAVTLMQGDLRAIGEALTLSRETVTNMKQNLGFAFAYNAIGIPIAAGVLFPFTGLLLSPMLAALAMSASSASVIGNALRLRRDQR
jgi:Cu+-exporting ATPase